MPDTHPPRDSDVDNAESSVTLCEWGDNVDTSTFEQILEMDDDEEEREFSRSIVFGFFEQAETTFSQIEEALESKDLLSLSTLGHFLKGSSATLGLTKVKNSCEKIQHFGQKKDHEGINDEKDPEKCLKKIDETFHTLKKDYAEAVQILKTFFGVPANSEGTKEDEPQLKTISSSLSTSAEMELKANVEAAAIDLNKTTSSSTLVEPDIKIIDAPENSSQQSKRNLDIRNTPEDTDSTKTPETQMDSKESDSAPKDHTSTNTTTATKDDVLKRKDLDPNSKNRTISTDVMSDSSKNSTVLGTTMITAAKLTSVS